MDYYYTPDTYLIHTLFHTRKLQKCLRQGVKWYCTLKSHFKSNKKGYQRLLTIEEQR